MSQEALSQVICLRLVGNDEDEIEKVRKMKLKGRQIARDLKFQISFVKFQSNYRR